MLFTFSNTLEKPYLLRSNEYWGTRQQLRAGKVIADWIDPLNGPLDPVFGVLLCPTAGDYFFLGYFLKEYCILNSDSLKRICRYLQNLKLKEASTNCFGSDFVFKYS